MSAEPRRRGAPRGLPSLRRPRAGRAFPLVLCLLLVGPSGSEAGRVRSSGPARHATGPAAVDEGADLAPIEPSGPAPVTTGTAMDDGPSPRAADPSPAATCPSPGSTGPGPVAADPSPGSTATAVIPVPEPPAPSGPPARPPLPEPEGLRAADLAPVTSGPLIPVPDGSRDDWGQDSPPAPAPAGTRFLKLLGTVVDPVAKKPVPDVEVSLPELDLRALSGPDGLFMIHGIPARDRAYELLLTAPGFQVGFAELVAPRAAPTSSITTTLELKPLGW